MAEWQTRTTQNRVSQGVRVRVPPSAQMKKKVLVIVGPTASGKSALGVKLAQKFNGEVISADSRQVYKGLDIGTGKITKSEMHGIPHHLLDVANPRSQFSAAEYKKLALKKIEEILEKNKLPIIVGGTGFYIDALTLNLPEVPPNKDLRKRLEKKSAEELFKILKKKDKVRAKTIDKHNKVRLIRALEIIESLGKVPKYREHLNNNFILIGLLPKNIDNRIYKRLLKRLPGIIREVKKLHNPPAGGGLSWKRMHELGLEYRYIAMFLQNKLNKEETIEKLYTEIKKYSKRQRLWFKRNREIKWFNPDSPSSLNGATRWLKAQLSQE